MSTARIGQHDPTDATSGVDWDYGQPQDDAAYRRALPASIANKVIATDRFYQPMSSTPTNEHDIGVAPRFFRAVPVAWWVFDGLIAGHFVIRKFATA